MRGWEYTVRHRSTASSVRGVCGDELEVLKTLPQKLSTLLRIYPAHEPSAALGMS